MKNSQVPVRETLQNDPSSHVSNIPAGQVPVRQTTEGDRRGNSSDRGCVSPLGKAGLGYTNYPHGGPLQGQIGKKY